MKIRNVIEIHTESLEEESFIQTRFPQAVWISGHGFGRRDGETTFYLDSKYTNEVTKAIRDWKEANKDFITHLADKRTEGK